MERWEQKTRQRAHQRKVHSAKPSVRTRTTSAKPTAPVPNSLLSLLHQFNLQKFYKPLKDKGQSIHSLSELTTKGISTLGSTVGMHRGQIYQLSNLVKLLRELNCAHAKHESDTSAEQHSEDVALETLQRELEEAKAMIAQLEQQLAYHPPAPIFEEAKNNRNVSQFVGKSIDSWKVKSTLTSLDIEETCKSMSRAIQQHIQTTRDQASKVTHALANVFIEEESDPDDAYNFIRNLVARGQLENQVPILAMVYLERLIAKSGIRLTSCNWKRLVFIAVIEASKVWDDESFENPSFAQAFSRFSLVQIRQMEASFLTLLEFDMKVSSSDFAKAYFLLRSYTQDKDSSFPLQAMDLQSVLKLERKSLEFETLQRLNQSVA